MNNKLIRALSALITASMLASAVPCVSAAEMPDAASDEEAVISALETAETDEETAADDAVLSTMADAVGGHLVNMDFEDYDAGDTTVVSSSDAAVAFEVIDGDDIGADTGKVLKMGKIASSDAGAKITIAGVSWGSGIGERVVVTSFSIASELTSSSEAANYVLGDGTSAKNISGGFSMYQGKLRIMTGDGSGDPKGTNLSAYSSGKWYKVNMVSYVDENDKLTKTEYYIDGVKQSGICIPNGISGTGVKPDRFRVDFDKTVNNTAFYMDNLTVVDFRQEIDYLDNLVEYNLDVPTTIFNGEDEVQLPSEFNGASIKWTSQDESIISVGADGKAEVNHGDSEKTVKLTARLTYNGEPGYQVSGVSLASDVEHEFTVTVEPGGELSDEMKAQRAASVLTLDTVTATEDFNLPLTSVYTNKDGSKIEGTVSWKSDSSNIVIDGANARVTQPGFSQSDTIVTLTALVTVGTATETKTFTITVPKSEKPQTDAEKILYTENQLLSLNFDEKGKKVTSASIHLPTEIEIDGEVIATVAWTSDNTEYMLDDGTLLQQPATGTYALNLTAVIKAGSETETNVYPVVIRGAEIVKAYPGAQGYGTQTRGGAGGYVCHVTTLAADGPGSLKEALETKVGARIIVFDVGGTIDLTSVGRALKISGDDDCNLTIAGQTAPGEGIQLKGYGLTLSNVKDVIIRNISIRIGNVRKYGDTYQSDPLSVSGANERVVLDHLSLCWGVDMGFRVYGQQITMSNCMINKGLYWNTPHEKGKHNYAGMFGPKYGTFYGNYIADCGQRAPRIIDNEYIDVRNNVIANSKYTFDICNYEWMGANTKFNIVNNVVLKGNPAPGGSTSNVTSAGSYKYFQGRAYSGGLFTYSINNYDNTKGGRAINEKDELIDGAIWTGAADSNDMSKLAKEMQAFSPSGYSNITSSYYDMIFPDNISLEDYDSSLVSQQGNTLMNYPFPAPSVKTYSPKEAAKYVLSNVGSRGTVDGDILTRRYVAEGRTRLHIYSDYSKVSKKYGIQLPEDLEGDTAYGLPVQTHTIYEDENGMSVYDVDGRNVSESEAAKYTVKERFKFVSCENHLDGMYAMDVKGNKYLLVLRDYTEEDDIYDAFDLYDINNKKLTKPSPYSSDADSSWTDGMHWGDGIVLNWADWGDGPGNYNHEDSTITDGNIGTEQADTEWNEYDWPQLPTVYRDGKWDSNGDGIPDFFIKLMGWDKNPAYSPNKDISRLDFEGRGYTNIEYYINDYCCGDQELEDTDEDEPAVAENVRDGSSKYNTHVSHEILFNTVKRAKAKVFYNEGEVFDMDSAKEIPLNSVYDYAGNTAKYSSATDFDTYFSAILSDLKPNTTYAYKIKTYSDTGVEHMGAETYHFTTLEASTGKPGTPRVVKYVPFDEQITLTFEPYSKDKSYNQSSHGDYKLTQLGNNEYDTKTDHYILRYSENADMSDAKSIELSAVTTVYTIKGLTNNKDYYIDLRAVSADGTESNPAIYNQKTASKTGTQDKDGNDVYEVKTISVNGGSVSEYYKEYDVALSTIAIQPTKFVINVDYAEAFKEENITEGETTKFTTIYGDVHDWYIYTLGGIPIPTTPEGGDSPILMLRDESHDHGFTYAKKFSTPLSGRATIETRIMIKDEVLDPMNQAPEFRFYLQQDAADSDNADGDDGEGAADTGTAAEATTFGTIVSLSFSKNDINYDGKAISRYADGVWYDLKILLDGDNGTCSVYINNKLVSSDLEYSDSATSNTIARWQISSRLAGTEDVYVAYMKAYTGWEEPVTDPDATPKPENTVQEGTSGSRPSSGGGG
ncbi:MAG: immunoglobulin-like domain-containing protein, partial [Candidatus Ornithomonoglobus sp.]